MLIVFNSLHCEQQRLLRLKVYSLDRLHLPCFQFFMGSLGPVPLLL